MSNIFIQPDLTNFDDFLEYAKQQGFNLEIASFAFANVLDTNWETVLDDYKKKLQDFKGTISLHGAFQDLILHSRDRRISEVAKNRYIQNFEIAKALNAKYIVFHGNFNPLIGHKSYIQNWIEQNTRFWSDVISKYDITILIENVWESSPEIFRRLLNEVKSPQLKICLDTGHANIFSKVPIEQWMSELHKDIPYIHVNDNKGDVDNELVPGEGIINWREFSDNIKKYGMAPNIVFEVGTLEKTKLAIKYFKENNIYPFNQLHHKMEIRKLNKKDIKKVSQLIKECFLNLNIGGHTKKGIDIQIKANSPENLERQSKNIKYFVAIDENKIIGICGYDNNKVHTLFVDINYHKKGIGKQLLNYVLNEAINEGLKCIKTWSTFYAERFYSSFGFIKKKEIYLPEGSEDIILIEMEKNLIRNTHKK